MKPLTQPTGGNRSATGGFEAQRASVHADLKAVFAGVLSDQPPPAAPKGAGPGRNRVRSRGMLTFAVTAVALLIAGTLTILAWSRRPSTTIAATSATSVRTPPVTPAARPASSAPVMIEAPSEIDIPAPPPPPAEPVAAAASRQRSTTKVAVIGTARKPVTTPRKRGNAVVASAAEPSDDHPQSVAPECSGRYEAWCLREVTAAADRELREAYGTAVQSKVDRSNLKRIRREWVRYRRLANKRPRELIRGYAELTVDLRGSASQKTK